MPEGNPEAYMDEGMSEEEAMMAAGMAPDPMMAADPMGAMAPPPMDAMSMMPMLIEAVLGKWAGTEAQLAGEQDMLLQTLMMLAQPPQPMMGPDMMMGGM